MPKIARTLDSEKGKGLKADPNSGTFIYLCQKYGFKLIPLTGKKPIEKDWPNKGRGHLDFDCSDFDGRNAGILCGKAGGILGLDIDDLTAFKALRAANGLKMIKTFKVRTGAGLHYYYQYPRDGKEYGNRSFKHPIYKKHTVFDVKGNGGYLVAPGSVHPDTGRQYKIINDMLPALPPDWLLKFILEEKL
jgi:hypothetical protein